MTPIFFASPEEFREWLETNGAQETELWVGFHKKGTGRPSMTWPEAVDQALCFGWIDGVRKRVDDEQLCQPLHPPPRQERLERGQHQTRRGAHRRRADAPGRARCVRAAPGRPVGHLRLRAAPYRHPGRGLRAAVPRQRRRPGPSSSPSPHPIGKRPSGGSSAPRKTRPSAAAWPPSSPTRPPVARCRR